MRYRHLLWDWNGTLLDDTDFSMGLINCMLAERGLPVRSREQHGWLFDFPVQGYYERLGFDFTMEAFDAVSSSFVRAYLSGNKDCPLHDHALEALATVRASGVQQWILSASHQDHLDAVVAHKGIAAYFAGLLGIQSIHAPGKIDRGRQWLAQTACNPAEVLLIGDTTHDVEVASAMGIDCWLVGRGHQPLERLRATGRPTFASLAELPWLELAAPVNGSRPSSPGSRTAS